MNEQDALAIIQRIQAYWPEQWTQGRIDAWLEELQPLDEGITGTVIVRLAHELDKPPSIARFHRDYEATAPKRTETPMACSRCDGYGWLERIEDHHDHRYTFAVPCSCPAGKARVPVVERIVAANTRTAP